MNVGASQLKGNIEIGLGVEQISKLPYDPAIALLGIYPKDTDVVKRRAMFIAAMAMVAKQWKEPRCPSTDEWIRKMRSIYTMDYVCLQKKG